MKFRAKVIRNDSEIVELVLEAATPEEAEQIALKSGVAVISISSQWVGGNKGQHRRFPLLFFSQELLALLDSGIVLMEAFQTLAEKEARPFVRELLQQIIARLKEGNNFSDVLAGHPDVFPSLLVASVRASEKTGEVNEALRRYIAYMQQLEQLRAKVVSAAIYPVLLLAVGGLVIAFLLGYVVPSFSHIYEGVGGDLPLMSQLLMAWGTFLNKHWGPMAAVFIGLFFALSWFVRQPAFKQRMGELFWRIPSLGNRLRTFQLARFYRTVGMLLNGGMAIVPALEIVGPLLPTVLQPQLGKAIQGIREGLPISAAMDRNNLATRVALRMMRVGERAGNMGEMMERIAVFHDAQIARDTDVFTRLFGPLLMLVIGGMIGGIVIMMYLPIFQLAESVG